MFVSRIFSNFMQRSVEPRLYFGHLLRLNFQALPHHKSVSKTGYTKLAYTVEEVAEMLSVSRAHIYRLLDLRLLDSIHIGRSRRITTGQLAAFIRASEQREGKRV